MVGIMNGAKPEGDSSEVDPQRPEDQRIVVKLPYAIANMVLIQSLPFWILVIVGVLSFLSGFLMTASRADTDRALAALIGSAVCGLLGGVGLVILKRTLWRWALEGYTSWVTLLYILYVIGIILGPFFVLAVAAFVFLPMALNTSIGGWLWAAMIFCGLLWLLALMNVFEGEIWTFARLDGRCPRCRQWRFGRIRRPQIVRCEHCGTELRFVRPD
jgi:hypothetical protein